jgi:hypothetical protein
MAAEEARTRRETLKVPESPAAFSGKPRTSLHPPGTSPLEPAVAGAEARPWSRGARPEPAEASGEGALASVAPADGPAAVTAATDRGPERGDAEVPRSGSKDGKGKGGADAGAAVEPNAHPATRDEGPPEGKKRKKDEDRSAEPTPVAPAAAGSSPDGGTPSDGSKPGPELDLEPDAEVDRVLLAKEFSGLLQVEAPDDEAQS